MSRNKQGLSREQIEFIEKHRSQGLTWTEVAGLFEDEFEVSHTKDSMRLKYNYWAGEEPDYDNIEELKKMHRSREAAQTTRKALKKAVAAQVSLDDILTEMRKIAGDIKKVPAVKMQKSDPKKIKVTEEVLIGDIQIGKVGPDYNSEISRKRMIEHSEKVVMRIKQHQTLGYDVERIVVSMLGDMIESAHKHSNSQRATDCSNPEQMRLITVNLFHYFIKPLAELGIPLEFQCVTGNHDWDGHKLEMFYPGREHLSWMFYHMLEELCSVAGWKHVKFNIAEGSFIIYDIYGQNVLIEHGVGVAANEKAMSNRLNSRIRQTKQHITYFRMGDKHSPNFYNSNQYVINGAYFGSDEKGVEYSGILGYYSPAAQVMLTHVKRKKGDPRSTIYDVFTIQLSHIK